MDKFVIAFSLQPSITPKMTPLYKLAFPCLFAGLIGVFSSCGGGGNSSSSFADSASADIRREGLLAKGISSFPSLTCEDSIDLRDVVIDTTEVRTQLSNFSNWFKCYDGSSNIPWIDPNQNVSISELSRLYAEQLESRLPECDRSHYITALKIWLGADEAHKLVYLFQPVILVVNDTLSRDSVTYTIPNTDTLEYFVRTVSSSGDTVLTSIGWRDAKIFKDDYVSTMRSKKTSQASTFTPMQTDMTWEGDTRYCLLPYQKISLVSRGSAALPLSIMSAAEEYGKFRGDTEPRNQRTRHHLIYTVRNTEAAMVYADRSSNCPEECDLISFKIQAR
jgi:hypothetical protein